MEAVQYDSDDSNTKLKNVVVVENPFVNGGNNG